MGLAVRGAGAGLRASLLLTEGALLLPSLLAACLWSRMAGTGLGLRAPGGRATLQAAAAGLSLWAGSLGLFELQYTVWAPPPGFLESFWALHQALKPHGLLDAAWSVGAIAVAPAVCEETVFRGVLLPSFRQAAGRAAAVGATALLFSLIHVDAAAGALTFYRVPFALVLGLAFGWMRLATGSLPLVVVAHAVLNTLTFLAAPLIDPPGPTLPPARPALGLGLLAVGGLLTALAWRGLGRRERASGDAC
jgi:membrane protease YdiL (CAAX protease family)